MHHIFWMPPSFPMSSEQFFLSCLLKQIVPYLGKFYGLTPQWTSGRLGLMPKQMPKKLGITPPQNPCSLLSECILARSAPRNHLSKCCIRLVNSKYNWVTFSFLALEVKYQVPNSKKTWMMNISISNVYLLFQFWGPTFCPEHRPVSVSHIFCCFIWFIVRQWWITL